MKTYERCSAVTLMPNAPIFIRVDGKAFHTFTKRMGFDAPFDSRYIDTMTETAIAVSHEMQNFVAAYVQSDEVTFLLHSPKAESQHWFGGKVQKLTSISASYMTAYFNMILKEKFDNVDESQPGLFDARAFSVPPHEIANVFLWRMKDWRRNSVQMYARSFFSNKDLHGVSNDDIVQMIVDSGKLPWTELEPRLRNGTLILNDGFSGRISMTDFTIGYFEIHKLLMRVIEKDAFPDSESEQDSSNSTCS